MWPLSPHRNHIVGITFDDDTMSCSWISPNHDRLIVHAYYEVHLDRNELYNTRIFNHSRILHEITTFLNQHALNHSYVLFALSGSGLYETIVDHAAVQDSHNELSTLVWDTYDIIPTYYYRAGIAREILFAYQLLALKAQLNCLAITTLCQTLIAVHDYYRQPCSLPDGTLTSQTLQQELENTYHSLCSSMHVPPHLHIETRSLLSSVGLFLLGKKLYEQY